MRTISLLLLLLLALGATPAPVAFTAQWDTATSATVQWTQTARGCLYRESAIGEQVFIGCYARFPATIVVTLGGPQTDAAFRPTTGDVYVLQMDGVTYRAPLVARPVYFPVFL